MHHTRGLGRRSPLTAPMPPRKLPTPRQGMESRSPIGIATATLICSSRWEARVLAIATTTSCFRTRGRGIPGWA